MSDDLEQPALRAVRYWYVDGTFELAFGGLCLLLAVYFCAQAIVRDSWIAALLSVIFVVVIVGGGRLFARLLRVLKERLTYPRTGYVAYRRMRGTQRGVRIAVVAAVAAMLADLLTVLVIRRPEGLKLVAGATGLIFGGALAWTGYRAGLPRFYVLAVLSLLIGAAISVSRLDQDLGLSIFYGALSVALLTSGGVTLGRYLRHNPPPEEAPDGH